MSAAFDGTSSRIALPAGFFNYERNQPWSVSAFVYPTSAKSGALYSDVVMSRLETSSPNRGIEISLLWTAAILAPNNKLVLSVFLSSTFSNNRLARNGSTDIPANAWTQIGVTYDGSSGPSGLKLYANGARETETTGQNNLSSTILNAVTPMLGSRGASAEWYPGEMQYFGAWDVALTDAEMASLGKGFAPQAVRPQSLVLSTPLVRDVFDMKGGALTATNMSVGSNSPGVYA